MKYIKIVLISFFSLLIFTSKAQQNHFIYIQTENRQPFYVKLNTNLYSSSATGYLIISKLKEQSYDLAIGFPKNEWPEQKLTCNVADKDLGFLLKNFGDKGWGLFNLQTLDVVMADSKEKKAPAEVITKNDEFSNLLSDVVNDPTIKQVEVVKQPEPAPASVKQADTVALETITVVTPAVFSESSDTSSAIATTSDIETPSPLIINSVIKRSLYNKNGEGTEMIFTDSHDGATDTVTVFIPVDKNTVTDVIPKVQSPEQNVAVVEPEAPVKKEEATPLERANRTEPVTDQRFIDIDLSARPIQSDKKSVPAKETSETVIKDKDDQQAVPVIEMKKEEKKPVQAATNADTSSPSIEMTKKEEKSPSIEMTKEERKPEPSIEKTKEDKKPEPSIEMKKSERETVVPKKHNQPEIIVKSTGMINSDCKTLATDDDFMKLRKKMAAEESDDNMIAQAKKYYKSKCFTVEQVKNLSVLFLKDAGKYSFFDLSYAFVSDSQNYSLLGAELTDPYYINRFQAMIRR